MYQPFLVKLMITKQLNNNKVKRTENMLALLVWQCTLGACVLKVLFHLLWTREGCVAECLNWRENLSHKRHHTQNWVYNYVHNQLAWLSDIPPVGFVEWVYRKGPEGKDFHYILYKSDGWSLEILKGTPKRYYQNMGVSFPHQPGWGIAVF